MPENHVEDVTTGELRFMVAPKPSAKLQILSLPSERVGDAERYPFALVLSEADWSMDAAAADRLDEFRKNCGAVAILVTPHPVEAL